MKRSEFILKLAEKYIALRWDINEQIFIADLEEDCRKLVRRASLLADALTNNYSGLFE